jgi:hypothetical protein
MLSIAAVSRNRNRPDIQYKHRPKQQHQPDTGCEQQSATHDHDYNHHDYAFEQQLRHESSERSVELQPEHRNAVEHDAQRDLWTDFDHSWRNRSDVGSGKSHSSAFQHDRPERCDGTWRKLHFILNQHEPQHNQHDPVRQFEQPDGNQLRGSQLFVQLNQHHRSERTERRRRYDSQRDQHHDRQQRC